MGSNDPVLGLVILGAIFLIIALSTYFSGCNPDTKDGCTSYKPFNPGYIYEHEIITDTCRECRRHVKNKCVSYEYYDCYTAFVYADKGANTSSWCEMQVAYQERYKSNANSALKAYPIGEKVHWLKMRNSDKCQTPKAAYGLWVTGVVFFALFGCVCGIPLVAVIFGGSFGLIKDSSSGCGNQYYADYRNWPCFANRRRDYEQTDNENNGSGAVQMI